MTKIINLFAGPGAGKSSTAYALAGMMKWEGMSCELVTEYAKDLVWQKSLEVLNNQAYVFGKQYQRIFKLIDQVEYIITDSPLLLSIYYDRGRTQYFPEMVYNIINKYENINFFIMREKKYDPKGRLQTKKEAIQIDADVKKMLENYGQFYTNIPGNKDNWQIILDCVLNQKI